MVYLQVLHPVLLFGLNVLFRGKLSAEGGIEEPNQQSGKIQFITWHTR